MTKRQREALEILERVGPEGISPRGFGLTFWPDSDMHKKHSNNTYGAQVGKAGWLAAGSYLGKLRKKGWARYGGWELRNYCITKEGRKALQLEREKDNEQAKI